MGLKLGTTAISDIKLGTNQIYKAYQGSSVVWDSGITPPTPTIRALKFESSGAQTLGVDTTKLGTIAPNFQYSTDGGSTWTTWTVSSPISFGNGTDLYIRGSNTILAKVVSNKAYYVNFVFSTNSPVECTGNVMHLFDYTQDLTTFPADTDTSNRGLRQLFYNCSALITAPELPATTLVGHSYRGMFGGCTSLTTAPDLPATTVPLYCYYSMFSGCTSLVNAPSIGATTSLGSDSDACMWDMFSGCTSLNTIPEIAISNSAPPRGYQAMFAGCTNIKMSTTQSSEYPNEYIIGGTYSLSSPGYMMFDNTGGTFTGTAVRPLYTPNTIIPSTPS